MNQNRYSCSCVKLVNKVVHFWGWRKIIFEWGNMASKNSYRWNDGKNCYNVVFSMGYENSRDEL